MFDTIRKTTGFFAGYVFQGEKGVKVASGMFIDLIDTALNVVTPVLLANYLHKEKENEVVLEASLILSCAIVVSRLLPKVRGLLISSVASRVEKELSLDMLRKCFDLELATHVATRKGEFQQLLAKNYTTVEKLIPAFFGDAVPFAFDAAAVTGALASINSEDRLVSLFPPAILVIYFSFLNYSFNQSKAIRNKGAVVGQQAFGMLVQSLGTYKIAHQFENINHELKKVTPTLTTAENLVRQSQNIDHVTALAQTVVNYAGLMAAFIYAGYQFSRGILALDDFLVIAYLMYYFSLRLEAFTPVLGALQNGYIDAQKIIEFRNRVSRVTDLDDAQDLELRDPLDKPLLESQKQRSAKRYSLNSYEPSSCAPSIEFDNVFFSYPAENNNPSRPVFKGLSFKVEAGQTIAIVGETGAGKSTIVELLQRFYPCGEGNILIKGINIQTVTARSLRSHIAIVSQDANLFNDTVRTNIRYGNLDATEKEIREVAFYAGLIKGITDDEAKFLDKPVGEDGKQISGGEKQRVAIARALLRGGVIFLLDEATSALDAKTEKEVQDTLTSINKNATTIIITHKLHTLVSVDRIFYLEDGVIIEQGSFKDLVTLQKKFYSQLQTQCQQLGINIDNLNLPDSSATKPLTGLEGKEEQAAGVTIAKVNSSSSNRSFSIASNWYKRQPFLSQRPKNTASAEDDDFNNNNSGETSPLLSINNTR